MRRGYIPFALAVLVSVVALGGQIACTQAAPPPPPKPASDATVLQVMRGGPRCGTLAAGPDATAIARCKGPAGRGRRQPPRAAYIDHRRVWSEQDASCTRIARQPLHCGTRDRRRGELELSRRRTRCALQRLHRRGHLQVRPLSGALRD